MRLASPALRHASWHDGDAKFDYLPYGERPYNCLWGDGSELSAEELRELRELHDRNMEQLRLEVGDIIVSDITMAPTRYSQSKMTNCAN